MDSLSNIKENDVLYVKIIKKHPNIYLFVNVLKKVQQIAYVAMNNSASAPARIGYPNMNEKRDSLYFCSVFSNRKSYRSYQYSVILKFILIVPT